MVLKWHLKIVQLVSRNQNQFVTVRYFVSLLLKKEERESLCLTPFLLLKVLFNSYLTQPPFIRFKWANKSIVLVCLIMFVVLFAMSIWNLDSVVAAGKTHLVDSLEHTSAFRHLNSLDDLGRT